MKQQPKYTGSESSAQGYSHEQPKTVDPAGVGLVHANAVNGGIEQTGLPNDDRDPSKLSRQEFVDLLVEKNCISQELADSGRLERFAVWGSGDTEFDSLKHIFIGDSDKGLHHLPTMLALGQPNRAVASRLYHPDERRQQDKEQIAGIIDREQEQIKKTGDNTFSRERNNYRKLQRVREDGIFRACDIVIDGVISVARLRDTTIPSPNPAEDGSSFFPSEWSTQEVIEAILRVDAQDDGTNNPNDEDKYVLDYTIDNISIRVVKYKDGTIVSAYPCIALR